MLERFFPDLAAYRLGFLRFDVTAALAVTFMAVPQGIAYAMIAGLPPATGLFAGALPTIVGSLLRSSSHVVTGPTNALSLLVGTAVAASATDDPVTAAFVLALMVGIFQAAAGLLRLGTIVDYISTSVVAGYITGAGVLIGIGQLPNLTGTPGARGDVWTQLSTWAAGLSELHPASVAFGLGTTAVIIGLRFLPRRPPSAILVLAAGVFLSWLLGLDAWGIRLARDIAPVPAGLPPLTLPTLDAFRADLLPIALAATVLSLVESSAVARSIAARTGQRLSPNQEFFGQGMANIAAGLTGGYPTSGSLARSSLSERAGARSRIAGLLAGTLMIVVLLFAGPLVDLTPIPVLAGLLLVIAWDLVDVERIRAILGGSLGDRLAFIATLLGTWMLPLDQAIYLGVGISIVLFLRRARQLLVRRLDIVDGRLSEVATDSPVSTGPVRVLQVEGDLFFGAASELTEAIDDAADDPDVQVIVLRLKRTRHLDYTTATVLEAAHARLAHEGRHLLLVGLRPGAMDLLRRVGVAEKLGVDALYPTRERWFAAMEKALEDAVELAGGPEAVPALHDYVEHARSA